MWRRLLLSTLVLGKILAGTTVASAGPAAETPVAIVDAAAASGDALEPEHPPSAARAAETPAAIVSGDAFEPEHLLGDWGGLRTDLLAKGVNLNLGYVSETAAVVAGGQRQGVDYAHSIDLKTDIDMQTLVGLSGFSLHVAMVERAGRDASADFMGDHVFEVQEIYGGGGDVAAHLAYLYAEQSLAGGAVDIEAGRLIVGDDFAESPLYCEFMSHANCPTLRDLGVTTGFTTYPDGTWGARVKIAPGDELALKAGLYQVRPLFGGRSGFDWFGSGSTGVILPMELDWTPRLGPDRLVGHYKLGLAFDSSSYPDLDVVAGPPRQGRGRTDGYILGDQMLKRTGPNGTDGIILLAGYSRSDPNTSVIEELAYVGLLADGIVPGRSDNSVGVQVMSFHVSNQLAAAQAFQLANGLPLSSGLMGAPSPGAVQGEETDIEVRYGFRIREGFHLMPDFQYVIHPNATTRYPDAAVIGLRVTLAL